LVESITDCLVVSKLAGHVSKEIECDAIFLFTYDIFKLCYRRFEYDTFCEGFFNECELPSIPFLFYMAKKRPKRSLLLSDCISQCTQNKSPFFFEMCKVAGFHHLMAIALWLESSAEWVVLVTARHEEFSCLDKRKLENLLI